jgi:GntR family transcriptional regulator
MPSLLAHSRRASGPVAAVAHTEPNRQAGYCCRNWSRSVSSATARVYSYVAYKANVTNIVPVRDMINVGYLVVMADGRLNPYADTPLYEQLAAILRRRIESGELRHLDPLPSETSLTQEYEISRDTARRAVQALRDEGLVFTVAQRGTFVGPRPE